MVTLAWAGVPLAVFALLALRGRREGGDWRLSILSAAVVWGVMVTTISEGLSPFRALAFPWVAALWVLFGAATLVPAFTTRRLASGTTILDEVPDGSREHPRPPWWPLAGVAVVVATTGVIALIAPPNTYDSMTYHMSRVAHWVQNASVAHYPTHISRQLYQSPWAEFAILQLQILTGGDRLANLVQWASMLGSLVGVSLIARQLGGGGRAQIAAVVVGATIPMGILQASSTQNDYATAFWLVIFVVLVLAFLAEEPAPGRAARAALLGASLGLALLTKPTALAFALPFVGWLTAVEIGRRRWRAVPALALVALVVLALNLGHWTRNLETYGTPLPDRGYYGNGLVSAPALLSVIVKNAALHIGTPSAALNATLLRAIEVVHRGLGIEVDDWRTTVLGETLAIHRPPRHEDTAGNPLHLALIVLSLGVVTARALRGRGGTLVPYAGALVAGFVLFSLGLRWQPFHSRLQLPLFVLASPLIALALGRRRRVANAMMLIVLLASLPWLLMNRSRPLVGPDSIVRRDRLAQYFANRPDWHEPYTRAVEFIRARRCRDVGLVIGPDDAEYPWWALSARPGEQSIRISHIGEGPDEPVVPRRGRPPRPSPCAIVSTTPAGHRGAMTWGDIVYTPALAAGPVTVLTRDDGGRRPPAAVSAPPPALEAALRETSKASRPGSGRTLPEVRVTLSAARLAAGERVRVSLDADTPPTGPALALYAGVLFPGDGVGMMFSRPWVLTRPGVLTDAAHLVSMQTLPQGSTLRRPAFLEFWFPTDVRLGSYRAFALLAREGAFVDGRIDPGDIVAADLQTLEVVRAPH